MKYKSKPKVIEAVEFRGDSSLRNILNMGCAYSHGPGDCLAIHTLEGVMIASPGDFIIRGIQGEFYPCKPDIFHASYEAIKE